MIISDHWRPKFAHVLDYPSFSLRFHENEIDQVWPALLGTSEEKIMKMQKHLAAACPILKYNYPAQPGDATHSALEAWVLKLCQYGQLERVADGVDVRKRRRQRKHT